MTATSSMTEGLIPFSLPVGGEHCQTWYMLIGSLSSPKTPLVALHGGPGAGHEYLLPLQDLYHSHDIPVILYDQIGNGKSTHLREKAGDQSFWTESLFRAELDNLLRYLGLNGRGYHLLGHSWGGMLASAFAVRAPEGLRNLILLSAPASVDLMVKGTEKLRANLPKDVQEALKRCEENGAWESEEYEEACMVFYKRHLCRLDEWPEVLNIGMGHLKEDPTVYSTMNGPSEFFITGNLKHWTVMDQLHEIRANTLLINGRYDEVTDMAMQPFFDQLAKVRWVTLEKSSHTGHLEERERFMYVLGHFLTGSI